MISKLIYPYGTPSISGQLKSQAEDFKVTEELAFEVGGTAGEHGKGEHLLLFIEKSMMTTFDLIDRVAKDFGIKPRDIGYCGLKDKVAVTRQWLSLHLPGQMNRLKYPVVSDYKILDQAWHNKKLRPGTHRFNHFEVIIRNIDSCPETTLKQIDKIRVQGMANYFGVQRFGRQGDNFEQAVRVFGNARRTRKLSRSKRSLYLSSLRSYLFNRVLSTRIEQGIWEKPLCGDVFMLSGSHSIFHEPINDELLERFKCQDISSTISLYGTGNRLLQDQALEIEDSVLAEFEAAKEILLRQGAKLQMRNTRVAVTDFQVTFDNKDQVLYVEARLPRGSFFTTLLDHFIDTGRVQ